METEAFNSGWNANLDDKSIFTNPETDLTLARMWSEGWKACEREWHNLPTFKKQPDRK